MMRSQSSGQRSDDGRDVPSGEGFQAMRARFRSTRSRSAVWPLLVLGCAIAIAWNDYAHADPTAGPRIYADEFGYLENARYLAGRGIVSMKGLQFYAAGYSLILAPFTRLFGEHPLLLYRTAVV